MTNDTSFSEDSIIDADERIDDQIHAAIETIEREIKMVDDRASMLEAKRERLKLALSSTARKSSRKKAMKRPTLKRKVTKRQAFGQTKQTVTSVITALFQRPSGS